MSRARQVVLVAVTWTQFQLSALVERLFVALTNCPIVCVPLSLPLYLCLCLSACLTVCGLCQLWHLCPLSVQWQQNFCLSLNVDAKHPMPNPIPVPVALPTLFQLHLGSFSRPPSASTSRSLNKWPTANCKLFFSISVRDLFRSEGNLDDSCSPGCVADNATYI